MIDPDRELKNTVSEFLRSNQLRVAEIPRSASKTPDLIIEEGAPDSTLLELKQKTHDEEELSAYLKQMDDVGFAQRSRPTGHRNRLDGIIRFGVQQLVAKDPQRVHLRVLWIHCEGHDSHLHDMQLRATIYGTQKLFSNEHRNIITCFYFCDSSFYRYRQELDAVVISRGDGAQLALNDHSPRFSAIKSSKFASVFGAGVYFPQQYQITDDTMFCDYAGPRTSERTIIEYLMSKYGFTHLQIINMGMHEATASVEPPPDEKL